MLGELHADDLVKALRDMRCYSRKHGVGVVLEPLAESDEFALVDHAVEDEVYADNVDIGIADVDCVQDNWHGIDHTCCSFW